MASSPATTQVQGALLALERGRFAELAELTALLATPGTGWAGVRALVLAELGRVDEAVALARPLVMSGCEALATMPHDEREVVAIMVGEVAVLAGDAELATAARILLTPLRGRFATLAHATLTLGPIDRVLGLLDLTTGDAEGAVEELRAAVALADQAPLWRARASLGLAGALRARDEPGDVTEAAAPARRTWPSSGLADPARGGSAWLAAPAPPRRRAACAGLIRRSTAPSRRGRRPSTSSRGRGSRGTAVLPRVERPPGMFSNGGRRVGWRAAGASGGIMGEQRRSIGRIGSARAHVPVGIVAIATLFVGALVLPPLTPAAAAGPCTVTWVGASGAWETAANWRDTSTSASRVPTDTDTVCIDDGVVGASVVVTATGAKGVAGLANREELRLSGLLTIGEGGDVDNSGVLVLTNSADVAGTDGGVPRARREHRDRADRRVGLAVGLRAHGRGGFAGLGRGRLGHDDRGQPGSLDLTDPDGDVRVARAERLGVL